MTVTDLTLRTALPLKQSLSEYDPARGYLAHDCLFYQATLRGLAEVDETGRIVPAAALCFYWRDEELVFEFDPRFKTIDGLAITAADAAASLKRTMILKSNYRGYLDSLLDLPRLHTLDDDIPQIRVKGDKLVLRPLRRSPAVLEVLTTPDFAIFPRAAIDPATLEIRDFRNTTGPYYVASFGDPLVLKPNLASRHYSAAMPQVVEIMDDKRDASGMPRSFHEFRNETLDFIPHFNQLSSADREILQGLPGVTFHRTLPSVLVMGKFTPKGRLRSVRERRYIARNLQQSVAMHPHREFIEPTREVFPPGSGGALDLKRRATLMGEIEGCAMEEIPAVVLSVPDYAHSVYVRYFQASSFPLSIVAQTEEHLEFSYYKGGPDEPDILVEGMDLRHETELSFLAFALNTGVFGHTRLSAEKWLTDYALEQDEEVRHKMAQDLHIRALHTDPSVVPLLTSRFVALARNGWSTDFPSLVSLVPFWRMCKVRDR